MSQAKSLHLIFVNEVQSLNDGSRFKDVTFHDLHSVTRGMAGLGVQFEPDGPEYFYPWHTLARTKITRY